MSSKVKIMSMCNMQNAIVSIKANFDLIVTIHWLFYNHEDIKICVLVIIFFKYKQWK